MLLVTILDGLHCIAQETHPQRNRPTQEPEPPEVRRTVLFTDRYRSEQWPSRPGRNPWHSHPLMLLFGPLIPNSRFTVAAAAAAQHDTVRDKIEDTPL